VATDPVAGPGRVAAKDSTRQRSFNPSQRVLIASGAVISMDWIWRITATRALIALRRTPSSTRICSMPPSPVLASGRALRFGQSLRSSSVGVDRIGLPVPALGPSGPDNLADLDPLGHEVPGQAGAVGAGALDTDQPRAAEGADEGQQLLIAFRSRRDLQVSQPGAGNAEDRDVMGLGVRVDAGDDLELRRGVDDCGDGCCHDGTVPSSPVGTSARGRADKTLTGLTRLV
jgi:hypothetical protein